MNQEPLPPEATPDHLTTVLRAAGILGDGHVSNVVADSTRNTILSQIHRLRLTYHDAPDAPASLILKTAHPDRRGAGWNAGRQEVAFYTQVAAAMSAPPTPRCFDASWNAETNDWHILLEDLADTHVSATEWPLPPTMQHCEIIIRALARFHAAWWDDPRLGVSVGAWLDAEARNRRAQDFANVLEQFIGRVGDRLPRARHELLARVRDATPSLTARIASRRNLTIAHGDAHVWNCFLPKDASSDDARLFDWDSWHLDTATSDLAYMMAMHWYPDLRREREHRLLDLYHEALVAHGVHNYGRRDLEDDYRRSALWLVRLPVWQAANRIPPVIWWNNLERILLAVDDLDCRALLD